MSKLFSKKNRHRGVFLPIGGTFSSLFATFATHFGKKRQQIDKRSCLFVMNSGLEIGAFGHSNIRVFGHSSFRAFEHWSNRAFEHWSNRAFEQSRSQKAGHSLPAGRRWARLGGGRGVSHDCGQKKSTARGGQWIFLFPRQGLFFSLVERANRNAVPFGLVKHVAYAAALSSDAVSSDFVLVDEEVLDGSCTVLRELVVDFLRAFG